ncbi:hypothetical protein WJX74_010067 [Apatococcus lobatus]|uniref:Uncharacterized protein n=1 Tax=Apatococcus lobatus TaxID=904363 RepID=A0AAW1S499_9CHLO
MLHLSTPVKSTRLQSKQPQKASSCRLSCTAKGSCPSAQPASRQHEQVDKLTHKLANSGAGLLIASSLLLGTPTFPPPAQAESAAETRRAAAEQRKALMTKRREDALKNAFEVAPSPANGASESPQESKPESQPDASPSFSLQDDFQKQQAEQGSKMESKDLAPSTAAPIEEKRQPTPKAAVPKPEASKEAESAPAFSFGAAKQPVEAAKEAAKSFPKPEPKKPDAAPSFSFGSKPQGVQGEAAAPKPKVAVQGEAPKSITSMKADLKKQEANKGKKQKRKGPLPMTVAQLLILAAYGGLGYAVAVKDAEVRSVLGSTGRLIGQGYNKAVSAIPKQLKEKS